MDPFQRWLQHVGRFYPAIRQLGELAPFCTVAQRKTLLTQTRVQILPRQTTRLYTRNQNIYDSLICHDLPEDIAPRYITILELGRTIHPFNSPITSGLLSTIIRMAPYRTYDSVIDELTKTINKELTSMVEGMHPASFDYDAVLSRDTELLRSTRLYYNLPLNPYTQLEICRQLSDCKRILRSTLFYPKYSKKTIGRIGRIGLMHANRSEDPYECESTEDLEKFYERTGFRIAGPTELRWAWRYNDLKPRVYYARGPAQYYDSAIIQPVFNVIVDSLLSTNRWDRFHPETVDIQPGHTSFIYDYSSFTSNLGELPAFTNALADFFQDTEIHYIDTHSGVITANLGDILRLYNTTCNIRPDVDVSKVLVQEDLIMSHHTGMLGVPGNISSATLLHGIHLSIISGGTRNCKVVGDDAYGVVFPEQCSRDQLHEELSNLGDVAQEKMEFWEDDELLDMDDECWHYVKRPITRVGRRMDYGAQAIWPDLANILNLRDDFHVPPALSPSIRTKKYCAQAFRLLRHAQEISMTDIDIAVIRRYLIESHKTLGLPLGGGMVHLHGLPMATFVPSAFWSGDYEGDLVEATSGMMLMMPKVYDASHDTLPERFRVGGMFTYRSHPMLKLMVDMGYLEKRPRHVWRIGDESVDDLKMLLRGKLISSYTYSIIRKFPSYAEDVLLRRTPASSYAQHDPSGLSDSDSELDETTDL